jgi:hypothetical protein
LEEIRAIGKNRHDISEKLKTPITNPVISVLKKGQDGANVPNTQNYLALTNHRDAVIIEESDRRWFVMQTIFSESRSNPANYFSESYWDNYWKEINSESGSIRGWILSIDTAKFNPFRAPPSTAAKEFMKVHSKSNDSADVFELLELGNGYGYTKNVVCTELFSAAMKEAYGVNLRSIQIFNALTEIGLIKVDRTIKWKGKNRRVYVDRKFLSSCKDKEDQNSKIRNELDGTEVHKDPFSGYGLVNNKKEIN